GGPSVPGAEASLGVLRSSDASASMDPVSREASIEASASLGPPTSAFPTPAEPPPPPELEPACPPAPPGLESACPPPAPELAPACPPTPPLPRVGVFELPSLVPQPQRADASANVAIATVGTREKRGSLPGSAR